MKTEEKSQTKKNKQMKKKTVPFSKNLNTNVRQESPENRNGKTANI